MDQESPAETHRTAAARFTDVAEGVQDWDVPTPVKEWTARDVVRHLVEWFPGFLGSGSDVQLDPGPSADDDPVAAWAHQRDQVQALLEDPGRSGRPFRSPMVPEAPLEQVVDRFYTADVVMHTWDLARATGQDDTLDEAVIGPMLEGMRQMEGMIRASGQFGTEQPVGPDAGLQDRFVAFIGRDPGWRPPHQS